MAGLLRRGMVAAFGTLPLTLGSVTATAGNASGGDAGWRYTLLEGSTLTDECPVCGRPSIVLPMRGSFTLRLLNDNGLFATYALEDICLTAGGGSSTDYQVAGTGTLQVGGEVAVTQEAALEVVIEGASGKTEAHLASARGPLERLRPMILFTLRQTNGTLTQSYDLTLAAAPLREAWFSTTGDFTSANGPPADNRLGGGGLLSSSGRIVRRNEELTRRLGVMPVVPDLGLDGFDLRAGGDIVFSIGTDVFSESLGPLEAGDCLSESGMIVATNPSLLAAFAVEPPVSDSGLDAMHFLDTAIPAEGAGPGEVWFSIVEPRFSEKLGVTLRAGDILSSSGRIVRTNAQLCQGFRPVDPALDVGLDALYVWPSGEIWFSTESGFTGAGSVGYLGGDVLSDQGYVVFRNLELLHPFAPLEDRLEFGLDALWIVSDATPSVPPPAIERIDADRAAGDLRLRWQGKGRVFQVEGTADLADPWVAIGPILPDREFVDVGALLRQPLGFYRIRQW